ncbi:MAG: CPBP family intramembrane metalloprotease [Chloroflexi bacterium]|nr:CPBP family intramembrane metalloprotease [Chloroflexota bacterium]MBU1747691.1 CPBP family intramembrane metalloprotease [Chloroflexota bacterium]MBU1877407.1 CPBP family intramembrane metalloprotease [Chloroflexota bacterium]
MTNLTEYLKRHQLIAYFVLTYAFSWALWISFQQLVLDGQNFLMPLISLGVFAPALVSIGLSAVLKPRPRQGSRKPAVIAFIIVWILASSIIIMNLITNGQKDLSSSLVVISVITGLLPAFVASSIFSTIPGVRAHLRTYIKPRGAPGYYFLALVFFPAIWLLGNLLSRALGMEAPFSSYPTVDVELLGMVILFYLYNITYGGLSEEPGWRGFALPRLQAKFSPLVSSLILGVLWAVWHAPARFGGIEAKSPSDTLVEWVLIVLVTVIFTWFFNRTKGSILVTALVHPAMNTTGTFLTGTLGALILLFVFMLFVIVLDRMWKRLPADSPGMYKTTEETA